MSKNKVLIFDTTLRDGEQCPGASMNLREKLAVARQLSRLKVDVIEAGFPVISEGAFTAVQTISKQIKNAQIAGLARCVNKDRCGVEPRRQARTHSRFFGDLKNPSRT